METIAINNLYIAKMPKSCKECPLTYLDTGDDAYFGANEKRCVIDDSCVDGMVSERAYDCPLVEAYTKADMIDILKKIQLEIEEMSDSVVEGRTVTITSWKGMQKRICNIIQQKIDALKE